MRTWLLRDADVAPGEVVASQTGRIDALIESYGDNLIVVLPFGNTNSEPGAGLFSDGVAEELKLVEFELFSD